MPLVQTRLGRWSYEESGHRQGLPIVLFHGLFFDAGMWAGQAPMLAKGGRVIALDGPGHGKSELPPPFTLEDHADAVVDALDALGVESALLIGLSWGAMVALRVALAHPARVRGLALLGGSAEVESRRDIVAHRVAVALGRRVRLPELVARRALVPLILSPRTIQEEPALVERIVRTMRAQPAEGVARASLAIVERSRCLLGALPHIRKPALVICGADDRTTPVARSNRLAVGLPAARLAVLRGCGHMTALEKPTQVSDALCAFARELAEGAALRESAHSPRESAHSPRESAHEPVDQPLGQVAVRRIK